MASAEFRQGKYWQQRVSGNIDLGVVGHRAFSRKYNEYLYRRRVDLITECIGKLDKEVSELRILDIGCGSGFYTDFWKSLGVRQYVGLDISKDSVAQLSTKYPEYDFIQNDITATDISGKPGGTFDLITIFDVIYHIVDDDSAAVAYQRASELLRDDGTLFVFEQLGTRDYALTSHVKLRARQGYNRMLKNAGLKIDRNIKLFLFLSPPVSGIRPVDILIAGLYKLAGLVTKSSDMFSRLMGHGLYRLDNILLKKGLHVPNNELLIITRERMSH